MRQQVITNVAAIMKRHGAMNFDIPLLTPKVQQYDLVLYLIYM